MAGDIFRQGNVSCHLGCETISVRTMDSRSVRPRLHSRYRSLAVETPPPHPLAASRACFLPKKNIAGQPKVRKFRVPPFPLKMITFPRLYGGNYDARKNVVPRLVSIDFAMSRATVFGAPKSTSTEALAGSENRPFCFTIQIFAVFGQLKRRKLMGGRTSKSAIF